METEFKNRILEVKKRMGADLCILGHYYQRDEVIEFVDREGDSFSLAKLGSETRAKYIVFCGVHFMAEASAILAREDQRVFLPDMAAGCPLADMATIDDVEDAWKKLESLNLADKFLPVVYMNSTAELKAFCGKHGGCVCTSSSAEKAFKWAAAQNKNVFFFPDKNLGINTAHTLGIKDSEIFEWKIPSPLEGEGQGEGVLATARAIVWNGYCHVHTFFTVEQMKYLREKYPDCKIVVHPECDPQVVALADANGSTAFLKKYTEDAPKGSTIVIGTEINLVSRLARAHPDKKVIPLARSLCPNMFKISPSDLCFTLENFGIENEVFVEDGIARNAKLALDRMLAL